MKKKIFITSVGGDVACAILRCFQEIRESYEIIGCDINEYVQGKMYIDEFIVSPRYSNKENYIAFVCETCEKYHVDFFLPVGEQEIIIATQMREYFIEHNIKLIAVSDDVIHVATDKYNTYLMCREIGIGSPETIRLAKLKEDEKLPFDFPVILKKTTGCGAKGMQHIRDFKQLTEAVQNVEGDGWIVQQEVGDDEHEYTMGVFSDGKTASSIVFKRKLGFGSMSVRVETVADQELDIIAKKIAEKLNLYGSLNIQLRKSEGKYYVFEINPRLSSTSHFRHLNGFKDAVWWVQMLDDLQPSINFVTTSGKVGIKILDELMM